MRFQRGNTYLARRPLSVAARVAEICREENISEVSFHRWKQQFGQLEVNEARRLKELERENAQLKRIVADQLLENQALKEISRGNF